MTSLVSSWSHVRCCLQGTVPVDLTLTCSDSLCTFVPCSVLLCTFTSLAHAT